MTKPKNRPQRWRDALAAIEKTRDHLESFKADLETAFDDLRELQSEYQDWLDGIPENLAENSATAEKLEAICELDLDPDFSEIDDFIDNMTGDLNDVELPRGFGRD